MTEETANQMEATSTTAPGEGQASLGIGDLTAVVRIIDVCSQRGAFQGSELEAVGALRGRIQQFVNNNTSAADTEEGTESE